MATFDINSIIILVTLFVIFGVFLIFDLFKREEKYISFLAYIVAVIPVNYLWALSPAIDNFGVLEVYIVLIILWIVCLLRDLIGLLKKNKDFDDVVLFLGIAILIQLIISAILPSEQLNAVLQDDTTKFFYFYLPDIYNISYNETMVLAFRASATILVLLIILPLLIEVKDQEYPFIGLIIIIAIFTIPFLYLSYIWLAEAMFVLTFLLSVILFIILLIITKSGKE